MNNISHINPYNPNVPVEEASLFFGRQFEIDQILSRIIKHTPPISTILIGGRRIGKSSIINRLFNECYNITKDKTNVVIPVKISLNALSDLSINSIYEDIIINIIDSLSILWKIKIPLPKNNNKDSYKKFCSRFLNIYNKCREVHFNDVIFVLLIDEAERLLNKTWSEDIICNFRHLINESNLKNFISIVITGFRELHDYALTEMSGAGSPFGNAADWTYLTTLSKLDCRDLICNPLKYTLDDDIIEEIFSVSGGHPCITQFIMQKIWQPDPSQVSVKDTREISELFEKEKNIFESWKEKFTPIDEHIYWILTKYNKYLTVGKIKNQCGKNIIEGEISNSLNFLKYTGIISEDERKFGIAGTIFKDWFIMRYKNLKNKPISKFKLSIIVPIIVGILAIFSFIFDLPKRFVDFINYYDKSKYIIFNSSNGQIITGTICNENNDFLQGVIVSIPQMNLQDTTDASGNFNICINDTKHQKEDTLEICFIKEGYNNNTKKITFTNTQLSIVLKNKSD